MGRVEYKIWRATVFKRDGYSCVLCSRSSSSGVRLEANHIVRWCDVPNRRYDIANGVTLCASCHRAIHGREQDYEERFRAAISGRPTIALTNEERAQLAPIIQVCALCHQAFLHRKSPRRRRLFHFCGRECRRLFEVSISHDWRGLRRLIERAQQAVS